MTPEIENEKADCHLLYCFYSFFSAFRLFNCSDFVQQETSDDSNDDTNNDTSDNNNLAKSWNGRPGAPFGIIFLALL